MKVSLVNQFQGELYLARGSSGSADNSEAAAEKDVGGQGKIYDIEDVEELGAEFENGQLAFATAAERRVFNQRQVEVAKMRATKSVAAQSSKAAAVRAGPASDVDGDKKKRAVVGAAAEIVFARGPAGRKIGCGDQVGPIGTAGADAGLLDSGIDGERRAAGERGDVKNLPAGGQFAAEWKKKTHALKWQRLNRAESEYMGHVERGRTFFSRKV